MLPLLLLDEPELKLPLLLEELLDLLMLELLLLDEELLLGLFMLELLFLDEELLGLLTLELLLEEELLGLLMLDLLLEEELLLGLTYSELVRT